MWPVSTIINVSKFSLPAASLNSDKGVLHGEPTDPTLPFKILIFSETVEWAYGQYGETTAVKGLANLLYELCDPALEGFDEDTLYIGSGGVVIGGGNSTTGTFPIRVTSASFAADGVTLNDPRIAGKNLGLVLYNISQAPIYAPTGFTYTATGIVMNTGVGADVSDFDASANDYDIWIYQIFT